MGCCGAALIVVGDGRANVLVIVFPATGQPVLLRSIRKNVVLLARPFSLMPRTFEHTGGCGRRTFHCHLETTFAFF